MGRIIKNQTMAGTNLDRHGERLTPSELEQLFANWPDSLIAGVNHDLSKPPVCRAFNKRLESGPGDELTLVVDLEVLDEEHFSQFGGFSISFGRTRVRIGDGDALAEVSVNPRQFDFESLVKSAAPAARALGTIDVVERVEKASVLETALITIAVFVGAQTFSGFFNAAGAALFEWLRQRKRSDEPSGPVAVHFHLHLHANQRVPVIVLSLAPDVSFDEIRRLDGRHLVAEVEAQFGHLPIQKVVAHLAADGTVTVDHVTSLNGTLLYKVDGGV